MPSRNGRFSFQELFCLNIFEMQLFLHVINALELSVTRSFKFSCACQNGTLNGLHESLGTEPW